MGNNSHIIIHSFTVASEPAAILLSFLYAAGLVHYVFTGNR
jgi:hypothetical protein